MHIYICIYIIYIHIYILHILYIYYICLIFWLGRDVLWTRNLEISFKVCSEILFCWGLHCVKAGLLFIIFYILFIYFYVLFIYLFIYLYCFISYFFGFYTERVAVERCFHIYFSRFNYILIYLFIYLLIWGCHGGVHFWYSCMLMACNFINNEMLCAFTGLPSVGECISSKNNGYPRHFRLIRRLKIVDIVAALCK